MSDKVANALFDAYDIKRTLSCHNLDKINRVHGGTENDQNLGDLIADIIMFLETLDNDH